MKAYKVWDDYDDEGRMVVVYAATPGKAKRLGAGELDYSEWTSLHAVRQPQFDGLGGDALIRAQLADGWWFGCASLRCQKQVRDDEEGCVAKYVVRNGCVYCSSACCLRELRRQRDARIREWNAVERAVQQWPGDPIEHVYENTSGKPVVRRFSVLLRHHVTETLY